MSRETINEARIWCDGCGLTYLEIQTSVEIDAMKQCGWITRERNGGRQDLCPACRPDSPYDAVEAVQQLREWCERGHYSPDTLSEWQRGFLTARREVRAILDGGDSDDPTGTRTGEETR